MSNPAALVAIRKRLSEIAGIPTIIWPNEAKAVDPPFLTFDNGPQTARALTLDGEEAFELRPFLSLYVEPNTFTSAGDLVLWDIAQSFKMNTLITDGGGQRLGICLRTPVPDGGAPENGLFRRNMTLQVASYQTV